MTVQRCPSCGRAWDGAMCFACGHEAGKAVPASTGGAAPARVDASRSTPLTASLPVPSSDSPFLREPTLAAPRTSPPSPAPAIPVPQGAPPSFAPLPPLPPLSRPPSGAFVPGAPPSGPAALPRFGTSPSGPGAATAPGLGTPAFSLPTTGAAAGPASSAHLPPHPITFPGTMPQGPPTTRPGQFGGPTPSWPTVVNPSRPPAPPSSSAASAPALDLLLEQTADTKRPAEGAIEVLRQFWASPAAFAIVFLVGFVVTFGPGAIWKLRSPDLQTLIDSGQAHAVVALLEAREKESSLDKEEWVLYGHAIATAYGTYRRSDMLGKYAVAVQSKRTDATALQNTIEALGDAAVQRDAVALLKLAWPEELAVEARLQERTGDENVLLRRGAVNALVARNAPSEMVRSARARVAVVDLKTRACPTTKEGVTELQQLVKEKATAALKERKVADAILDLQGDADLAQVPCIDKRTVKALHQEVAALLEGGG